ncbi:MAG: MFS transporter [Hyphomonadaceae bacterium]|nr:MFS transporter [Hyphomonadaceae bacterium]
MNRSYLLFMLMLVYLLSFLDRQILSILAEDIKTDLDLSDTQLGLLTGLAFAVFYATLGIPVARLAERRDRVTILSVCVGLWSTMTAAGAFAGNFVLLALTRAGVGVGEAGSVAPAHAIISDVFPPERRSRAMAIFQLGVPLGILCGFFIGGVLSAQIGWRMTLFWVGLSGVVLAVLLRVTLRDPRPAEASASSPQKAPEKGALTQLLRQPGYIFTLLGATFASAAGYAILGFLPPYLIRTFGMSVETVGVNLSLIIGIGSGLGLFAGGMIGDALARRSPSGPLWICTISTLVSAPLFACAFLFSTQATVFAWLVGPFLLHLAWMGPNWAMVQTFAPPGGKATASAIVLLSINLLGLGLGPLVVGAASDVRLAAGSSNPLGEAMLIGPVMLVMAAACYALATRHVLSENTSKEAIFG